MPSLRERASIIPGGSMTRSKRVFGRFADSASGAVIWDTECREYIDMLCGLGAISLGYRYRHAVQGVCSLPWVDEVEAAEAVLQYVAPWASWVRFLKTGSEATHAAYRIALRVGPGSYTLLGDGAYHGWHEWCDGRNYMVRRYGPHMSVIDYDELDCAAVFVEPFRFTETNVEWLRSVRQWCDKRGALLVFDSMLYGGRWALGGASQYFGVQPDMECFGKALGNGTSIAFVVGTDRTKPYGEIPSGTFSGETSGLAALIDTLRVYTTKPVLEVMRLRGAQLMAGLCAVIPSELATVEGFPVCQRIKFHNPAHKLPFAEAMWDRGVLWYPGLTDTDHGVAMTMFSHTEQHISQVIQAATEAVATL